MLRPVEARAFLETMHPMPLPNSARFCCVRMSHESIEEFAQEQALAGHFETNYAAIEHELFKVRVVSRVYFQCPTNYSFEIKLY